jgi:hypothetical protein
MRYDQTEDGHNGVTVNIALIGGMQRMIKCYRAEAERHCVNLTVFNTAVVDIVPRIQNCDAVVIFTNMVSHRVRNIVMNIARSRNISVLMCHSCGVSSWRRFLGCLTNRPTFSAEPADEKASAGSAAVTAAEIFAS